MSTPSPERLSQVITNLRDDISTSGLSRPDVPDFTEDTSRTVRWMEQVISQLDVRGDDAEDQNPYTAFLEQSLVKLESDLRRAADRTGRDQTVIVCCIVSSVYELARSTGAGDSVNDVRKAVEESELVRWLTVFREMLVMIRSLRTSGFNLANVSLSLLSFDVSALIRQGLETVLIGPILAALTAYEIAIDTIGSRLTGIIQRTRCTPIIEMWSAILSFLYGGDAGFVRRARGFVFSAMVRLQRSMQLDIYAEGGEEELSIQQIDVLIEIIDKLLRSLHIFRVCRIPASTRPPVAPEDPSRPERTRDGGPNDPPGDTQDPTGPAADGPGGSDEEPRAARFEWIVDPDAPAADEWEGAASQGETTRPVFLTPANVAETLTDTFGVAREEAFRTAQQQACQEELSDEARRALEAIGAL